jgi:hypothetical protein
MNFHEVERELIHGKRLGRPVTRGKTIESKEGFYSIWVKDRLHFPAPFSHELVSRNTSLIYIGIADDLAQRLYRQELQQKSPATFFRSLGAILGYRPEPGSLCGKKNQHNYVFSPENTVKIVNWVDEHLEIAYCYCSSRAENFEPLLIKQYKPILNWTHNPSPFPLLKQLRSDCKRIARSATT